MAATTSERTVTVATSTSGKCRSCKGEIRLNQYVVSDFPWTHHARCLGVEPAPAKTAASAPQHGERKVAKFESRCPGCGETIPAGAPLFYDGGVRRYVSDCCV